MAGLTLEERVEALESRVAQLQDELRSTRRGKRKDWRRTIGAFTDHEGVKGILRDAMHLREADRKRAQSKLTTRRRSSR
jgi:predicted  nucleic acid-binding Zn-ribbon protein